MSGINGIGGSQPVQRVINQPVLREVETGQTAGASPKDRLELSGMGGLLKMLKGEKDVRSEKVAEVRAQLDAGTYEDDAKLDAAIERLLDDLNT